MSDLEYEPYGEEWKAQLKDLPKDLIIDMLQKVGKEKDSLFDKFTFLHSTKKRTFQNELSSLLNRYSKENESNTPDFILAKFLIGALRSFNIAVNQKKFHEMGIQVNKCEEQEYTTCESCTKQVTDVQELNQMEQDDDSNWFCAECWAELAPTMRKDWEELKRNGEIE